jgi:hypothetical protein
LGIGGWLYQQALTESPKNAVALSSLGLALFGCSDLVKPNDIMPRQWRYPLTIHPIRKTAQIGEQTSDRDQIVKFSLRAAEIYLNRGDVDRAVENLTRVIRYEPGVWQHIPG